MKKFYSIFLGFVMIFSLFAFFSNNSFYSQALENGSFAKIIASRCEVYENADFSSNKVTISNDENQEILHLKLNDVVEVIDQIGDFAKIKTENEIEGFVYKYYLTQNTSQIVYPVFNGTIRNQTAIYDIDYQETSFIAKKDQRVFIYKGYSEKKGYTSVQIVLDDQTLYNGYVLTKDVNPDGISGALIAGISIIVAGVTIILSLIFIKKRRKKAKARKTK